MLDFIASKAFYMPVFYIIGGVLLYMIIVKTISSISRFNIKGNVGLDKRKTTIVSLIKNIIKYIIAIIVIIMVLNLYGIDTTSIIASLGVVSLVIGLAFQDIIKDFLAGIFIIFDNAYAVGDVVKINDFMGEVVSLGLKTTKIKAYTGEVKILSNSAFNEVINYNLNNSNLILEIPVNYDVKIEKIEGLLEDIFKELEQDENVLDMQLLGVNSFEDSFYKYAFVVECKAMTHYGIKRKALKLIKQEMDRAGIKIPYNKVDVYIENNK